MVSAVRDGDDVTGRFKQRMQMERWYEEFQRFLRSKQAQQWAMARDCCSDVENTRGLRESWSRRGLGQRTKTRAATVQGWPLEC